jgi:hypothetical protein
MPAKEEEEKNLLLLFFAAKLTPLVVSVPAFACNFNRRCILLFVFASNQRNRWSIYFFLFFFHTTAMGQCVPG